MHDALEAGRTTDGTDCYTARNDRFVACERSPMSETERIRLTRLTEKGG